MTSMDEFIRDENFSVEFKHHTSIKSMTTPFPPLDFIHWCEMCDDIEKL